jgi:hypothetical protein
MPADPGLHDRMARILGPSLSPVFVLSPPHCGSDQLGRLLGRHPEIYAVSQLPLGDVRVTTKRPATSEQLAALGMDTVDVQNMLWDHLIRNLVARHGRSVLLDHTRGRVNHWSPLKVAFPAARWIFLIRDPAELLALTESADDGEATDDTGNPGSVAQRVADRLARVANARTRLPGLTVRYEELRANPSQVCAGVLDFLSLEPADLAADSVSWPAPIEPASSALPAELAAVAVDWGYA